MNECVSHIVYMGFLQICALVRAKPSHTILMKPCPSFQGWPGLAVLGAAPMAKAAGQESSRPGAEFFFMIVIVLVALSFLCGCAAGWKLKGCFAGSSVVMRPPRLARPAPPSTSVGSQSQCTYLRNRSTPRFHVLGSEVQG